jgi:hypothetical protein
VTAVRPAQPTQTTTNKKHKQGTPKAHAGSVHTTGAAARSKGQGAKKQTGATGEANASTPAKSAPQPKDSSGSAPSGPGTKH